MSQKNNPNFDFYSGSFEPQKNTPQEPHMRKTVHHPPLSDARLLKQNLTYSYSRVGFALASAIVLWLILSAVMIAVGTIISPDLAENMMFSTLAGTLPLYVVCTPLVFLIVADVPIVKQEKKKLSLSHFFILFLMAQGLMWAGNFIGERLMGIMGELTGIDFYNQLNDTVQLPIWFIAILTGILAPIFEELIFRKLLLDRMMPHGELCAILFNGVLFGLFHGNFYQFFYAASLGMLLSFVYIKTGRIRHCMLLHIAINFMGGIIPAILLQRIDYDRYLALDATNTAEVEAFYAEYGPQMSALSFFSLAQIIMGLCGIVLLILKMKQMVVERKDNQLPVRKAIKAAFFNVGMLCALTVCILLIVANILSYRVS